MKPRGLGQCSRERAIDLAIDRAIDEAAVLVLDGQEVSLTQTMVTVFERVLAEHGFKVVEAPRS